MRRIFLSLYFLLHASVAVAQPDTDSLVLSNPMVADSSQNTIEIRTSFNGAQLLIFGARNVPGEVIIAVRGPEANIRMRRKERIAGMWMNVEQAKYYELPLFFAMASTKPLDHIADIPTQTSLLLGTDPITQASRRKVNPVFDQALHETLRKKLWWQEPFASVEYFGESLFKARLTMPDNLPGGDYSVELYLFHNGQLRATQVIPVTVYKVGLEADLVRHAKENGLAYGLVAVLMALGGGWFAHRLFHRG